MDKSTLSNYGWVVIAVLVLSVMIALATPFGSYIATAVENTTQGLFDVQQKAMGVAGLVVDDQEFEESGGEPNKSIKTINIYTCCDNELLTTLEFESGMTWEQWLKSDYNVAFSYLGYGLGKLELHNSSNIRHSDGLLFFTDSLNGCSATGACKITDVIDESKCYFLCDD